MNKELDIKEELKSVRLITAGQIEIRLDTAIGKDGVLFKEIINVVRFDKVESGDFFEVEALEKIIKAFVRFEAANEFAFPVALAVAKLRVNGLEQEKDLGYIRLKDEGIRYLVEKERKIIEGELIEKTVLQGKAGIKAKGI